MEELVLGFIGKVLAYGGGGALVAYFLFKFLGKNWIENKFKEKLETIRKARKRALKKLRDMMSRDKEDFLN